MSFFGAQERIRVKDGHLRERLRRGPYQTEPYGPDAEWVTSFLRMTPQTIKQVVGRDASPNDDAMRIVYSWYVCYEQVHLITGEELVELRAAIAHEGEIGGDYLSPVSSSVDKGISIGAEPQSTFLCRLEEKVNLEIALRLSRGIQMPADAAPWAVHNVSATELCACKRILDGDYGVIAYLAPLLLGPGSDLAKRHGRTYTTPVNEARAWQLAIWYVPDLPDAELEVFRAAVAEIITRGRTTLPRPDSIAAQMGAALKAETSRRVMVAIMLARERRPAPPPERPAPPPEHLTPAAGLAQLLAELPSRPLEMIADAARALMLHDVRGGHRRRAARAR